ncbi:MAG: hypothetical protein V1848_01545 [Candidatus Magasanikbacteria bacterium]
MTRDDFLKRLNDLSFTKLAIVFHFRSGDGVERVSALVYMIDTANKDSVSYVALGDERRRLWRTVPYDDVLTVQDLLAFLSLEGT